MRKVVIVCTYYERQFQLTRTLFSLQNSKYENFEVVIVDDASPNNIELPELNYPVTVIKMTDKTWINPVIPFNFGIQTAIRKGAEVIIIQNAECYHVGDVISYASEVTNENYISFGCLSIDEETTFKPHDIEGLAKIAKGASKDGQTAWYNHPFYRPVGYHFCAAITTENMIRLNGFDERFAFGIGYDDNNLLERIKQILKVEITVIPFVVHQWHYNQQDHPQKSELIDENKKIYEQLKTMSYKAKHIITKDLCL